MQGAGAFDRLVTEARRLRANGKRAEAVREYRRALAAARAPAPAQVWEECLELEAELDPTADQQSELLALVKRFPLRERPVELLMLMYQRTGRTKEALDAYHRLKARLVIDSGVPPSERLRRLHDAIEDDDVPTVDQLPADVTHFVGRAGSLKQLNEPERVTVITGEAGVGKTALAVRWANQVRHRFPGGRLYLDLHGHDSEAVTADDALKWCLQALGVPPAMVPDPVTARAALLRSLLSRKEVLVLLDNANSVKQVRPLLDPPRGSAVVITSRDPLESLPDVRRVHLDRLDVGESYRLLRKLLGASRVDAEPDATDALAWACGHLPLALRVVAAELVAGRTRLITDTVAELVNGNTADRTTAALDLAYARLSPEARILLRRIGSAPCSDVTSGAASALLGRPDAAPLAALAAAHLVTQHQPGRYRMHDFIRGYAAALSAAEDDPVDQKSAVTRWVDHLLCTVDAAGITLSPPFQRLPRPPATHAPAFADGKEAADWLASEHHNVMAAVVWASENGLDNACVHLVDALRSCFWLTQDLGDWMRTARLGLAAAERDGDPELRAAMHCNHGLASYAHGRIPEAFEHNAKALALFEELNDWSGTATMLINFGLGHSRSSSWVIEQLTRAHALGVEHDCVATQLLSSIGMAIHRTHLGALREAFDTTTRCLELIPADDVQQLPFVLEPRGLLYLELGELDRAQETLHEALEASSASGNRTNGMFALSWLGYLSLRAGNDEHALAIFRLVLDETERLGSRRRIAEALIALAETQTLTNSAEAREMADRARDVFRDVSDIGGEVNAEIVLTEVNLMLGDPVAATTHVENAMTLIEQYEVGRHAGRAWYARAAVHLARREHEQARQAASQALAQHRKTGQRLHEVRDLMLLAEVLRQSGDRRAANRHATDAGNLCRAVVGRRAPDVLRAARARTRDPSSSW